MEQLNEVEFQERVYDDGEPCLVLFSRKDCHVCQEVHPVLEGLAEEYAGQDFGFYNIDVDEQRDLFQKMALKEDNQNHLLMHAIGANVSGQIGSVLAGGILLNLIPALIGG